MSKYSYQIPVRVMIENYRYKLNKEGLETDTRYIENYNICPRCQNEMKTYRGEINGASTVSAFLIMEKKLAVIYCLCKECTKKLMREAYTTNNDDGKKTEEFIYTKYPDLKPLNSGYTEEEAKEVMKIFNKIN